jgi:crotonobetainyl-CoA:carnitine CoA-transferase CaiB-like acyl-CoA transferase
MRKLRLDYDSLRQINERVILVMASAFGPDGPYADRVGFDGVAQAMSGAMNLTGFPGAPVRSIVSWVDYGTALHAAFGAMTALYSRSQTGKGQMVDVSLLSTGVMFMAPLLAELKTMGIKRAQTGNTGYYAAPSDAYRTCDGWILVPTIGDEMFRRWARLINRPDLIADPRLRDDISRGNNAEVITSAMSEWCATRSRKEALAELERARIPCGPVYDLDEVISDPQVNARGLLQEVEYPGGLSAVPLAATPVRMGDSAPAIRHRAPLVGEHTEEVLTELGFTAQQIATLRDEGAV